MPFPLQPEPNQTDPDLLLERFLAYVESKSLELYPAQEEAILELFSGKNLILNTPTGSGKSLVAAALHFLSASTGRRSVYTCPIKALVNEKFLSLCRDFGPENVGMMTGDASVNRNAPILCCTAEILSNVALRDGPQAAVHDIIMDEFHYYSDPDRGVAWQAPLLTLPQCRFLLISATLGDTAFFGRELERLTQRPCATVSSQQRPVPLEFTYLEDTLLEALDELGKQGRLPVYIVHFTQKSASDTAQNLLSLNVSSKEEKRALKEALQEASFTSPFGADIKKLLLSGVGLHHAGMLPKYRVLVEKLAQQGMLKFICGTDTLGVGVNVPIRTVLFTQLCKYGGRKTAILSARDFHQISGRAGRKGFDDVGYVVALAPEHVVENKRAEQKAAHDPKKRKKLVRRKPPARGFVHWDEETFRKLQRAQPEGLESQFDVSHGMLLNVLSRPGDGCRDMRRIISDCHNSESSKAALRRKGFQLFRALLERDIVTLAPSGEPGPKVRVNVELQDDFSLNQTLALFAIDAMGLLDLDDPDYALKLLSVVESILENPDAILQKQLDKLKGDKLAEMKDAGIEYDERMEKLDSMEHPKPEADFIYQTFNEFARLHPWVGSENIKPKSIAREMYERYSSFSDYVKLYGLKRSEGLLLRHLTNVYRVLDNTVPPVFRTEAVGEIHAYLEHLLRHVDSSLLDEWERLRDPDYRPTDADSDSLPEPRRPQDITRDRDAFLRLVRSEAFAFLRLLANKQYKAIDDQYELAPLFPAAAAQIEASASPPVAADDAAIVPRTRWLDTELERLMEPYYASHSWIRLDPAARSKEHTHVIESDDRKTWTLEQTLVDVDEQNDWLVAFTVDLDRSRTESRPVLSLAAIRPLQAPE